MKDVYVLLHEKEKDLQRVRREIDALRRVAHLLTENDQLNHQIDESSISSRHINKWPLDIKGVASLP